MSTSFQHFKSIQWTSSNYAPEGRVSFEENIYVLFFLMQGKNSEVLE